MSAKKEKNVKEKKKISLTSMIFIALIAGAITGMVLHYLVPDSSVKNDVIVEGVLYVLGQGFIRLMKMLVVPLVFCSLVCGSMAIGDTKKLGNVGGKTLAFYLVTTAKENGSTRATASMDKAAGLDKKLIFAIGNAPTALVRLYELIEDKKLDPELIIGVPVGFVNVVQSKELIMHTEVPYIVARGRKGGSNIAACICNALLYMIDNNRG